jgi:Putative  PD-(D/E)XK family member, (DUF4420)
MSIEDLFREAESAIGDSLFRRTSETAHVDLFVGRESGTLAIQLRSTDKPPSAPSIAALQIDVFPQADGTWWTLVRLLRPELRFLFVKLAEDLVRTTGDAVADAGNILMTRLAQWQRLFAPGPRKVLSDEGKRGLAGELSFIRDELVPEIGIREALSAWRGPFMAPRDFELQHCSIEVKAIRDTARALSISSLEQLDASTLPLYLWVRSVSLTPLQNDRHPTESLASLVQQIRSMAQHDPLAAEHFEHALAATGYHDHVDYGREQLTLLRRWCIEVREGFPRIERRSVPAGVLSCSYDISWHEATRFECDTWPRGRQ